MPEPDEPPPLLPVVRLPNIPPELDEEPPPDMPPPELPPPEPPNCAQTEGALTVMPKNINHERFNARDIGFSS